MKKHRIFAITVLVWSIVVVLIMRTSKVERTTRSLSIQSEMGNSSMTSGIIELIGNRTEEPDVTERSMKEGATSTTTRSVSPGKNASMKTTEKSSFKTPVTEMTEKPSTKTPVTEMTEKSSTKTPVTKIPGTKVPDSVTTANGVPTTTWSVITDAPGTKAPVTERKNETKSSSPANAVNPGCKAREVSKYVAPDTNKTYNHPNIVHYAKFNRSVSNAPVTLNFREYISVLSVQKFLKPEKIMFHTFTNFSGHYWDKVTSIKDINFEINVIPPVTKIGGKKVGYTEHQADYVKISMIHKHGGTALDFDVIMLNGTRWKYLQRKSECVLVEEPGVINGGLYSCIHNSAFMAKWLEGYHKDYKPNSWLYNASFKPMKMLQGKVCYNVHVDRTVCIDPTFKDRERWLKVKGADWKSKTGVHYYIKKDIPNDGEGLLKEKFSLAELIQYVYNA